MKYQKSMHCACIACINIDSVMRMEKKIEKCKYKIKKIKMVKFINTESESDSKSELESDTELESKSELKPDSNSG